MSSSYLDAQPSFLESFAIRLVQQGQIPTHIGFIMDGNRRYARERKQEAIAGHNKGFDKFLNMFNWCRILGVHQTTMYAFSIENFKRSPDEVTALMNLFYRAFEKMIKLSKADDFCTCVRVFGRLNLLPDNLQSIIAKLMSITAKNDRFYLNIAIPYTSRDEICRAVSTVKGQVKDGQMEVKEITDETLNDAMYFAGVPDPDILIRTSGEVRLSDFLIWQTGFSYVFFTKILWPVFSNWNLFESIFLYQVKAGHIRQVRESYADKMRLLQQKQQNNCNSNSFCFDFDSKLVSGKNCTTRQFPENVKASKNEPPFFRSGFLCVVFLIFFVFIIDLFNTI